MVLWYTIFPPPEPPPREFVETVEQEGAASNEIRRNSNEVADKDSSLSSAKPLTTIAEVDSSLPSKEVTIENEKYRLVLDTRGGIGKSLQLKQFKHTKPRLTLSTWFPFLTSFIGPDYQNEVTEENRVSRCQFGLFVDKVDGTFKAFSDGYISSGYAAILVSVFNVLSIEEQQQVTIDDFREFKIESLLTMTRSDGFYQMIELMIKKAGE
jgi:hypothetical protein